MKKHGNIIIALLTVLLVTFSFSGCEPDDELDDIISECDAEENQMTPESIPFILGCYVKYMDGNPAESFAVKMTIWAEACEGDISEEDTSSNLSLTDISGYWFSELYLSINYTNKKDVVSAIFYTTREGFPDYFHTEVYRWEDVENEHPTYVTITLPYNVGDAPLADFTANETSISVGQTIDFSDQSSNIPTSWEWNFGDGNTSSIQNPSHSYENAGSYTISLKAINDFGSGIETKEDYIEVQAGNTCDGFTIGGQTYNAVLIGDQCWMKDNLNLSSGNSWCYEDNSSNCTTYGRLYDWQSALNACPAGWHLPSDSDWNILRDNSGGQSYAGAVLKEAGYVHWNEPNTGASNSKDFTALPGGARYADGTCFNLGQVGLWWSSSEYSSDKGSNRAMNYTSKELGWGSNYKDRGLSVRCLKD